MSIVAEKERIRREARRIRAAIPPDERERLSTRICAHALAAIREWRAEADVLTYLPYGTEPDIGPLIDALNRAGYSVYAPATNPGAGTMAFRRIASRQEAVPGWKGIPEPKPTNREWRPSAAPLVLIAPGLAFSADGGRIGYGGGYYDRFAARHGWSAANRDPNRLVVAPAFAALIADRVPMEPHDLRVDLVVTEHGPLTGIDTKL